VRNSLALVVLFSTAIVALAQRADPERIVIEPKKPGSVPTVSAPGTSTGVSVLKGVDPNRPGFIVISPSRLVASTLLPLPAAASRVESKNGVPHVVIVGTNSKQPLPTTDPVKPVPGAKPAQPATEKVNDGKILLETYDTAYCRGCKVGYLHTLVREYERNGKKVVYGSKTLTLQILRFGQVVEQSTEESTVETEDGKILATKFHQKIGKNQELILRGEVTDKGLLVKAEGAVNGSDTIPWPENVVGVAKEATLLKDNKLKPGVDLTYKVYFGQFGGIITYTMSAKGFEEVTLPGAAKPKKLLKVVQEMKPVGEFRLPPVSYYLDPESYEPVKLECDMPAFGGVLSAIRTSREVALTKPAKYLDLADVQSIKLAAPVPGIHQKDTVTYRITLAGDLPLDKAFPTDARQKATATDAKTRTLDLAVTAIRTPVREAVALDPGKEFLSDSFYIDWNNDLVKKHAASAVAGLRSGATAWDKARAVETWVHHNMKQVEFSQAMGTCGNTAKELSGDCTEHAMLATGMCRALGIPARTALGLVYAPTKDGHATLAYHMWFEVWADGGWLALDAIMGLGSVGPGHIKITDAHWDGEKGFTPLLPVLNLLGTTPKVEVVK
jgi:Transglutaminase-like superfamily